jgi:hypothetical protein
MSTQYSEHGAKGFRVPSIHSSLVNERTELRGVSFLSNFVKAKESLLFAVVVLKEEHSVQDEDSELDL